MQRRAIVKKINVRILNDIQRTRLGDVAVFENRQLVTAAKFIPKS
jgi:hypothetical protein